MFHVNWFRQDKDGKFLWPGFGENLRVLRWIIERCENRVSCVESPIGLLPNPQDIDVSGLDVAQETMQTLLSIDVEQWQEEMISVGEYLDGFGDRLPDGLRREHQRIMDAMNEARATNS